jgi:hypothetical protein
MIKPATSNHTPHGRCPRQRKAHGPKSLSGPSNRQPQHPSGEPLCRSRGRHRTGNPRLARGCRTPSGKFPLRSRAWCPPRASSRLARWSQPLAWASALDPRHRTYSPDHGIKGSDTLWAPRSKVNPRHAGLLTPPRNQIPALFNQPALYSHPCAVRVLCRMASVIP